MTWVLGGTTKPSLCRSEGPEDQDVTRIQGSGSPGRPVGDGEQRPAEGVGRYGAQRSLTTGGAMEPFSVTVG